MNWSEAGAFLLFGVFSAIAVVFVYFFVKESKHLSDKEKKALYSPIELVDVTPNMARAQKLKPIP
jgi:hypothetical protein